MKEGRGRAPCCAKVGLNKGPWMPEEDTRLVAYVNKHGHANWRALPRLAGLARCGKSCRLRWINYLRPDIKRGNFSREEEDAIIKLHELLGNKWSKIASCLPGRTDNEIKNVWNTHLKKRVTRKEQKSTEELPSSASSITTASLSCSDEGESKIEVVQKEKNNLKTEIVVDEPNYSGMWDIQQDPPKTSPRASSSDAGLKDDGDRLLDLPEIAIEPSEIWNTSSCTSTSDMGLKDSDEHLFDLPEIAVEPSEIWNMIDGADDQDATTFKAGSNGGNANDAWLAYLEKELDLREEDCNNCMLMEGGDPIASYFQGQQSSPFPFLSFNFN